MQRNAAYRFAINFREEQPASRRRVIARKRGEFAIEVLKAQTEAERLCVLEKEFAGLRNLCG